MTMHDHLVSLLDQYTHGRYDISAATTAITGIATGLSLSEEDVYYLHRGLQNRSNRAYPLLELPITPSIAVAVPTLLIGAVISDSEILALAQRHFEGAAKDASIVHRNIAALAKAAIALRSARFHTALAAYSVIVLEGCEEEMVVQVFRGFASVYRHLNEPETAMEYVEKALSVQPSNHRILFSKGYLYHHFERLSTGTSSHYERAEEFYQKALEAAKPQGGWAVADYHLGLVKGHLGKSAEMGRFIANALGMFSQKRNYLDDINFSAAHILLQDIGPGLQILKDCLAFLEVEPILCAVKNVTKLVEDNRVLLQDGVARALKNYIAICTARTEDMRRGDELYREQTVVAKNRDESDMVTAAVVFIDVRGFTAWSSRISPHDHVEISSFLHEVYSLCLRHLRMTSSFVKFQGDGLMLVQRLYAITQDAIEEALHRLARALLDIRHDFSQLELAKRNNLQLGCGVVCGDLVRIVLSGGKYDYVGHRVNLAARLCNSARPEGIVVCADESVIANVTLNNANRKVFAESFHNTETKHLIGLKGIPDRIAVLTFGKVAFGEGITVDSELSVRNA